MTKLAPAVEIDQHMDALVDQTLESVYGADPEMEARYGKIGRQRCKEDIIFHYCTLTEAIAADDPKIFLQYIAWGKVVLASRNIPSDDMKVTLAQMGTVCKEVLSRPSAIAASDYLNRAIRNLPAMPDSVPSFIPPDAPLGSYTSRYIAALLTANRDEARSVVRGAMRGGARLEDVFVHIFERSQQEFGRLWQENEISVAQEHFATAATELIMAELSNPAPVERLPHSFVGTCASSESHCVGIRMISELLDRQGWKVYFTGANTPIPSIIDMFRHFPIQVLGISAATAMQLSNVRKLIESLRKSKGHSVKILVGGKIFNDSPMLWKSLGADGYAPNAVEGVELAKRLVVKKSLAKGKPRNSRAANGKNKKVYS